MYSFEKPRFRLGYAPTRRDMFAHPMAGENRKATDTVVRALAEQCDVEIVDIEGLQFQDKTFTFGSLSRTVPADTFLTDYEDSLIVAEHFRAQQVDALFVPFSNFGQEEAVAKLAKLLGVPLLVWAPRDPAPDGLGARPTDSQCGIFAATKVLSRYGVPFTYIENCRPDEEAFARGFTDFIATARIVHAFKSARIMQFSVRPQQFMSVTVNEGELLEKFGIELVPITGAQLVTVIEDILKNETDMVDELVADIEKTIDMSRLKDKRVIGAIELGIMKLAKQYRCTAIAIDCWHTLRKAFGVGPCFVLGDLNDRGLPAACELDIHAAITSLMATAATGNKAASFVADLTIRHPEDDNCELLWHCGPFAKQLKAPDAKGYIVEDGQGFYPLKQGEVTVLRFDGLGGKYNCFVGKGTSVDGPVTNGNYIWLQVDDWVKWEKKFIYGPYIHHVIGVYGDYRNAFQDACRYLGLTYDTPDTPNF